MRSPMGSRSSWRGSTALASSMMATGTVASICCSSVAGGGEDMVFGSTVVEGAGRGDQGTKECTSMAMPTAWRCARLLWMAEAPALYLRHRVATASACSAHVRSGCCRCAPSSRAMPKPLSCCASAAHTSSPRASATSPPHSR